MMSELFININYVSVAWFQLLAGKEHNTFAFENKHACHADEYIVEKILELKQRLKLSASQQNAY